MKTKKSDPLPLGNMVTFYDEQGLVVAEEFVLSGTPAKKEPKSTTSKNSLKIARVKQERNPNENQ